MNYHFFFNLKRLESKINELDIVVFDFETGGLDISKGAEAIQIAGKAYNARTLEPYPVDQGGEFCSLMKPLKMENLDEKALAINKKTKEELAAAPDQKVVWNQFVDWVGKWNKKKSKWGAPIGAGKNIRHFDMKFVEDLNNKHCAKKSKTVLFNERTHIDLEDFIFHWFEGSNELENHKMDTLRKYFGLRTELGHDALEDVRQTGVLIMKFLKVYRVLRSRKTPDGSPLIQLKGAFTGKGI